jgi:energy-converting hydrogenase Eha subunit F
MGVKVIVNEQLPPALSTAGATGQVLALIAKSLAVIPEKPKPSIEVASAPTLVIVILRLLLAPTLVLLKEIAEGLNSRVLVAKPLPVRAMDCGDPLASEAICTVAASGPTALGEKVNETVQVAPTARLLLQALPVKAYSLNRKSAAFVPAIVIAPRVIGVVPVFVRVTV